MSGMVERVARVLAWEQRRSEMFWQEWIPEARAVIEAMRAPTDDMIDAVPVDIPTEGMIVEVWVSMIDAALSDASAPMKETAT